MEGDYKVHINIGKALALASNAADTDRDRVPLDSEVDGLCTPGISDDSDRGSFAGTGALFKHRASPTHQSPSDADADVDGEIGLLDHW
jgi:hypothetical protein